MAIGSRQVLLLVPCAFVSSYSARAFPGALLALSSLVPGLRLPLPPLLPAEVVESFFTSSPPPSPDPIGGCFSQVLDGWEPISAEEWVLAVLRHGYKIPFWSGPPPGGTPSGFWLLLARVYERQSSTLGGINPSQQGCSEKGSNNTMFLQPSLHDSQVFRRVSTCLGSVGSQQLYPHHQVPDGDHRNGTVSHSPE